MTVSWPPTPSTNEERRVVAPSGKLGLSFVNSLSHLLPPDAPPRIDKVGADSPLLSEVSVGEYVLSASCGDSSWTWDARGDGLSAFLAKHSDTQKHVLTVAKGMDGMGVTKEAVKELINANTKSQFTSSHNPFVGLSQLNEEVGKAQPGDYCKVEYHAYFVKPKKSTKTGEEKEELICFKSTNHHPAKIFQIHPRLGQPDYEAKLSEFPKVGNGRAVGVPKLPVDVTRGLMEGTALMSLGETSRIRVAPEYGYGPQGRKAYERNSAQEDLQTQMALDPGLAMSQLSGSYPNVLPHSTLVYEVTLMRICRDSKWYYRKVPPMTGSAVANDVANTCCQCLAS